MTTQIYVNLPVNDRKRSVAFFTALGFTFNADFSDENAACMIVIGLYAAERGQLRIATVDL